MTTAKILPVEIKYPSKATLAKYGLSLDEWRQYLDTSGGVCFICKKVPSSGRFVVDHLHKVGFKKMKPQEKKKFVRGVICGHCNRFYLAKGMTIPKAENLVKYLTEFEKRKNG